MALENDVAAAIVMMRQEKRIYRDYLPEEAIRAGEQMYGSVKDLDENLIGEIVDILYQEMPEEYPYPAVWWYSVFCNLKKDPDIFLKFIKYIRNHENAFSENTLYFLFYQCKTMAFSFSTMDNAIVRKELWKMFLDVVERFKRSISADLGFIPYEERDHNLIVVITEQMLGLQHGPTKTALDRCKIIVDKMKKNVLLINTEEILSHVGNIPFCTVQLGNRFPKAKEYDFWNWKGTSIPYFQCEEGMPNEDILNELLLTIQKLAPERVVSIGGSSILSNLVNNMIPVLTVGLIPSELECVASSYQTLSRKVTEEDLEMLQSLGFDKSHVIESVFTSSLLPKKEKISRADLGIQEDVFLLVVVGARLDEEITEGFLQMLEEGMNEKMHLLFLGNFSGFQSYLQKYPGLMKKASYLGFCNDILSRLEICDLYVNPIRRGGGTSCVEALHMGVPVVTTAYGDVGINAGEEFLVNDYREMKEKIMRYFSDKAYYDKMSRRARLRAEILLDSETEFVRILQEAEKRELAGNYGTIQRGMC